jgi:hypothetical protein
MPADQAAGLRRRSARQPVRCLHCFFDAGLSSTRLAQALHQMGQVSLLIDMRGRVFADAPTRSLFNSSQQLARGALCILPQDYGDGWYAPGIRADEANLRTAAQGYDCVVFDAGPVRAGLALWPDAFNGVIVEIQSSHESMLRAYTLLKSLGHADVPARIVLLGEPAACDHVRAACSRFLGPSFTQAVHSMAYEEDAFAALAIRMVAETGGERSPATRIIRGINQDHGR